MTAYYSEIDPKAAAWLRELIAQGHIAPGFVDERSIEDVTPADLAGYTQCHFFAGIGGWSLALRQAGWPDDRPVWTGSCPCQPFSSAGKKSGVADERHLFPAFHYLITECGPAVVFGEQVASKDGLGWLDIVQVDLEGAGYACGAVDTCSAGFGAPHLRQRQWFAAERLGDSQSRGRRECGHASQQGRSGHIDGSGSISGRLERAVGVGRERRLYRGPGQEREVINGQAGRNRATVGLANGISVRQHQGWPGNPEEERNGVAGDVRTAARQSTAGPTNGLWRDADWLFCRDGKWRPVQPGTFPLVDGLPGRVGLLRGYGNAINVKAAKAFIEAYQETECFRLTYRVGVFA